MAAAPAAIAACTDVAAPGVDWSHCNLAGKILTNANLTNANLRSSSLIGANLMRANLTGAMIRNADLSNANLTRAILNNANMTATNLRRAILQDTQLWGTDLAYADLREARIERAGFHGANLTHANLTRTTGAASFSEANVGTEDELSGANLTDADFTGATSAPGRYHLTSTGRWIEDTDGIWGNGTTICRTHLADGSVCNIGCPESGALAALTNICDNRPGR